MKRRSVPLVCGVVVFSLVALLFVVLQDNSQSGVPPTIAFKGFTNNSVGNPAAVLVVNNHSKRIINYIVYPAQKRDLAGWPQEMPLASLLIFNELPPGMSTNHITDLADFRFPSRFPVEFGFKPTVLENTIQRMRTAFHRRSLKPVLDPNFPTFAFMLTNVVYSEELPVIESGRPTAGSEVQQ